MNNKAAYIPRIKEIYKKEVLPKLTEKLGLANPMACPRLEKIVVSSGVGLAREDSKILDTIKKDLSLITGQMPKITRARKAISNFKIRQGMPIGCVVALRKNIMYDFFDRFVNIACPRIKDFRGFSRRAFDGQGNYNLGIDEQTIFVEIDSAKVEKTFGMDITFVTSAYDDVQAEELLRLMGFPFRR